MPEPHTLPFEGGVEAAPARQRVRLLALVLFGRLLLLAGRAVELAFSGDPTAAPQTHALQSATARADIVDRNGVLLATTVRAFAMTATTARVWSPEETAERLSQIFPDLDRDATERRLQDRTHTLVYLRRGLTPNQRAAVETLGLAGIGFEDEDRRVYPNNELAAQALGYTNRDLVAQTGVEKGLDAEIQAAGRAGRLVRLSLDVRMQHALDVELNAAAGRFHASDAAAILIDGKNGETLAMSSWPSFDPNDPGAVSNEVRRDRVGADVHELGSTLKPFTVAMALDDHRTTPGEQFNLAPPYRVGGDLITDHDPFTGSGNLGDILARSSNIGAAQLALRVGAQRQRFYLDRLGLLSASSLELPHPQAPIAPQTRVERDVAGLGFGYGLSATQAALAGAYTVFVNGGARVSPTLLARTPGDGIARTPVFSTGATQIVLGYLRGVVTNGTGRAADVPGLEMAGKTGTAETLGDDKTYDQSRNFSSFAGVFPASNPRYVIVVSLNGVGQGGAGGTVAAPAVGRIAERIAPMLGLAVAPRGQAR
jgi:cell division protein FtsI (penicillin-binding protein 3)